MFESVASSVPEVSHPRDARLLRLALDRAPGAASVALLERIDPAALCAADRVDLLSWWEAHEGWLLARRAAAVVAVAGAEPEESADGLAEDSVRMEVATAIRVTPTTAGHRIDTARFVHAHPALAAALAAGRIGYGHLAVLERELSAAGEATVSAVLDEVLPGAAGETPSRLRQRTRRSLARLDADAIGDRIRANASTRSCSLSPEPDLVGRLTVLGPWEMTAWAYRQFDAWARAQRDRARADARDGSADSTDDGCDPSLSALRADAVVEAARLLALSMGLPGTDVAEHQHRGRARSWSTAVVVCDLPTALGLVDEPGFVPGYGWVPAAVARELLARADSWRRFLTDHEMLVDAGSTRYRPSNALRELITARDQTCVFPGCAVPAALADLDHTHSYDGHNTTAANLRPLCRRHHRLKTHHPGWALHSDRDGPEWTTPTGHRHRTRPQPLWQTTQRIIADRRRRGSLARAGWQPSPGPAA